MTKDAQLSPPPEVFKEMEALVKKAREVDSALAGQKQYMWEHRVGLHESGDPGGKMNCWACRADPRWKFEEVIEELKENGWTP